MSIVHGIHHITAISSDPQATYDFYAKTLGLRLVKKTVNQDDTATYHLFFGDKEGSPGMDLTFFTFQPAHQGRRGTGLVTTISLAVPEDSLVFWMKRFKKLKVKHDEVVEQYGIQTMMFYDHDDQRFELVGIKKERLKDDGNVWTTDEISENEAIRYFDSATLSVSSLAQIEPVLLTLGYEQVSKDGHISLYQLPGVERAGFLQVDESPDQEQGLNMAGTVHHIAFQVKDSAEELAMREKIVRLGLYPTTVIDRFYFKSVYFRTPAGILFELATNGPGFATDESDQHLGEKLALPPFLEDQREEIEKELVPIVM